MCVAFSLNFLIFKLKVERSDHFLREACIARSVAKVIKVSKLEYKMYVQKVTYEILKIFVRGTQALRQRIP